MTMVTLPPAMAEFLAPLLHEVQAAAERGAEKGARKVLDELRPRKLDMQTLAQKLCKTPSALKTWLSRHPSFPREKVGGKLVFDEGKVDAWLAERQKR